MYRPSLGVWLNTDPEGVQGDSPNLYQFVGDNPVNRTDPTGLAAEPGPPSLPPEATEKEKQEAKKWIKEQQQKQRWFLKLTDKNYTVQGPVGTGTENNWDCKGLVAGAVQPKFDWKKDFPPQPLPLGERTRDEIFAGVRKLFAGFTPTKNEDITLEDGKQKIAVLGEPGKGNKFDVRHYALQLPNGKWISKLGAFGPTIIHDDLASLQDAYGKVIAVYERPNAAYKKK